MNTQLVAAFPPGEFLAEELQARDWSQSDFADILGRPIQFVSEIITGKKEITRESAAQISAALGTSAEYWLNLQNSYLLWLASQDPRQRTRLDRIRRNARLNDLAPINELRRRGILRGTTLDEVEEEIRELFGIDDLDQDPGFLGAARRTNREQAPTPTQKAWLACAHRAAVGLVTASYDGAGLADLAGQVGRLASNNEGFHHLQERYADVGVRLAYVEALPGSRLDGASFLADDGYPVIVLSGRGQRLDKVLFVLLHETAHVTLGHVTRAATFIDEGDYGTDPKEREANEQAVRWALPRGIPQPPSRIQRTWVSEQARRNEVHPVVVVGHLQNQGVVPWRSVLAKGAPTVTEALSTWRSNLSPTPTGQTGESARASPGQPRQHVSPSQQVSRSEPG